MPGEKSPGNQTGNGMNIEQAHKLLIGKEDHVVLVRSHNTYRRSINGAWLHNRHVEDEPLVVPMDKVIDYMGGHFAQIFFPDCHVETYDFAVQPARGPYLPRLFRLGYYRAEPEPIYRDPFAWEGALACFTGQECWECPYEPGTDGQNGWHKGWKRAAESCEFCPSIMKRSERAAS